MGSPEPAAVSFLAAAAAFSAGTEGCGRTNPRPGTEATELFAGLLVVS